MVRALNYSVIPNDWSNLEYIINDMASHIVDEGDTLLPVYILADGSRAYTGTGVGFKDEDNLGAGNGVEDATASQQSIKAYIASLGFGSFDTGGVAFAQDSSTLITDAANLFWDDSNNRLGIGTSTPTTQLEITGNTAQTMSMFCYTDGPATTAAIQLYKSNSNVIGTLTVSDYGDEYTKPTVSFSQNRVHVSYHEDGAMSRDKYITTWQTPVNINSSSLIERIHAGSSKLFYFYDE